MTSHRVTPPLIAAAARQLTGEGDAAAAALAALRSAARPATGHPPLDGLLDRLLRETQDALHAWAADLFADAAVLERAGATYLRGEQACVPPPVGGP